MDATSSGMRPHDWAFFVEIGAGVMALTSLLGGHVVWALMWAVVAIAAGVAARRWSLTHRGPMPHSISWTLFLPRGAHSPRNLQRVLQARPGEHMLEIGPGVGIHSLPIASALRPDGTLDVLDVQQAMLDDLTRRAATAGVTNIAPRRGDARSLPYADHTFDAAYLVTVLGEIPDQPAALRELRRVLKPDGRLVIGEFFLDPDFIRLATLKREAADAGLIFERSVGSAAVYLAAFRPAPSAAAA
jgi:SAM-dependent methyltransferase